VLDGDAAGIDAEPLEERGHGERGRQVVRLAVQTDAQVVSVSQPFDTRLLGRVGCYAADTGS
jgi:hypothetical protein